MYIEEIRNRAAYEALLHQEGLGSVGAVDYSAGVFEGRELLAAASLKGDVIMGVAVSDSRQGDGLAAQIISHILAYAIQKGIQPLYLFTKPDKISIFTSLGFHKIAEARPYACMLEYGNGFEKWLASLKAQAFSGAPEASVSAGASGSAAAGRPPEAAAIVMNCNPFTNGHLYLAETAAAENEYVYIFVVEEDISLFPFEARLELARRAAAHLKNVRVIPGGKFIISSMTFPSYFTKEAELAKAHASMDLEIFRRHIAPALNIRRRYAGTEPLSPVTNTYNETMLELLPPAGIEVRIIERLQSPDAPLSGPGAADTPLSAPGSPDAPVSASRVRSLIENGELEAIRCLVPAPTFEYICGSCQELQNKIRNSEDQKHRR